MNISQMCILTYTLVAIYCVITIVFFHLKSHKSPALYSLLSAQIILVLWLIFGMIEINSESDSQLYLMVRFTLFPVCFIGGFWLLFSLYYADKIPSFRTLKGKMIVLAVFTPLIITYIPALTDRLFPLIIKDKHFYNTIDTKWGDFFVANLLFTYTYFVSSMIVVILKSIKEYKRLKNKIILIILAPLITLGVHIVTSLRMIPPPGFDLTPVSFSISISLLSLAVFKYKVFDPVPTITYDIFDNLEDATIIFDHQGKISNCNKSASKELNCYFDISSCNDIYEFLNMLKQTTTKSEEIDKAIDSVNLNIEMFNCKLVMDKNQDYAAWKSYDLYIKTFKQRDKRRGGFVSLKNNSIVLYEERSRIASEFHNTLNNAVCAIKSSLADALESQEFQANTNLSKEYEGIEKAYGTSKELLLEIPKIINELCPIDIQQIGLFEALNRLIKRVDSRRMNIQIYHNDIDFDKISQNKQLAYALYAIVMEAISNSYKRGRAKNLGIQITKKQKSLKLYICDDGMGCDKIYFDNGLIDMQKKILALGGTINFSSSIDGGFSITIEIPFSFISF